MNMKKAYVKPQLFAESFELMEHVAGPCDGLENNASGDFKVTHRNGVACGIWDTGLKLFQSKTNDCDDTWDEMQFYEVTSVEELIAKVGDSCYNAFMPGSNLFAS